MAMRGTPIQTAFNGGELSPEMLGRVDVDRYRTSLARVRNLIGSPRGPLRRRAGTRLLARLADQGHTARLVEFIPRDDIAYVLEFGDRRLRIWRWDGSLVTDAPEVVTNGDFAATIAGWADESEPGASIAWDAAGALRLNADPGTERVQNGGFDGSASGWFGESFLYISSQGAVQVRSFHVSGPEGGQTILGFLAQQVGGLAPGATYTLRFRVRQVSGTTCRWSFAGATGTVGEGLHAVTATASATQHQVRFEPAGLGWVILDDVSISTTATAAAEQVVAVTPGQSYTLRLEILDGPVTVRIGTTSGGADLLADTPLQTGTHERTIQTTDSTAVIRLFSGVPGRRVASVSLRLTTAAPVELTTPYEEADLAQLQWAQSVDVLYLVDGRHQPHKLLRYGDTVWSLVPVTFRLPPTEEAGFAPTTSLTPGATTGDAVTVTAGATVFLAADVGRDIVGVGGPGRAEILSQAGQTAQVKILEPFASVTPLLSGQWKLDGSPRAACTPSVQNLGQTGTLTLDKAGWRETDVGKFVRIHGGVCEITAFTSATVVQMIVRSSLSATTAAQAEAWTLEEPLWSDDKGWPGVIAFHDSRLMLGSGEQVRGSVIDDYENFRVGSQDADAIAFRPASGRLNTIRWFASLEDLLVGTSGPIMRLIETDATLTPTAPPRLRRAARYAAAPIRPVIVEPYVLYVEAGGGRLWQLAFEDTVDAYQPEELSLFADHLARPGLAELVFQETPTPYVWARTAAGSLLAIRWLPKELVLAWFPCPIAGGAVESMVVVPTPSGGQVLWLLVRRQIAGQTVRTIEVLDPTARVYLDSYVRYAGAPTTTVTGLGHLEGQTVQVMADGRAVGTQVVTAGQITLEAAASEVLVGLPCPASFTTLPHEGSNPAGTALGKQKRYSKLYLYVEDTTGCRVDGERLDAREPEEAVVHGGEGQVAIVEVVPGGGWTRGAQITVEQTDPTPLTVLALFGELVTG